jgi:hypothetical protein
MKLSMEFTVLGEPLTAILEDNILEKAAPHLDEASLG